MFDNDVLVIQHTLSSCNKCIFIHWMNTLIITEAELIIKGDATVQLRISAVLLRKPGRWDAPYAMIKVDFKSVKYISKNPKGLFVTWIVNWLIKPFTMYGIAYVACYLLKLPHNIAAPAGMIGASNFFELAVAVAIALFGTTSEAALATTVGVLTEVPVMLMLVRIANKTKGRFL